MIIIKVEQVTSKNGTVLYLKNNNEWQTITDFEPYFYVAKSTIIDSKFFKYIKRIEDTDKLGIDNAQLKKIVCFTPDNVGHLRREYFDENNIPTYEADIVFTKRFMIDKGIKQSNNTKLFYDMECATEGNNATDYTKPTTVHGFNVNGTYHQFVWHPNYTEAKKEKRLWTDRLYGTQHIWNVYMFPDEHSMLIKVAEFIKHVSPDIITEFSRDFFDIPWLYNRMMILGIDPKMILPIDIKKNIRVDEKEVNIPFYEVVNICDLYKDYKTSQLESYSLDNICKFEFNLHHKKTVGKYMHVKNFITEWQNNTEEFLRYNLCDVELMVNLDKTLELFAHYSKRVDFIGCEYNDIKSLKSMARVFCCRSAKDCGVVAPTLRERNIYTIQQSISTKPKINLIPARSEIIEERKLSENLYVFLVETDEELDDRVLRDLNRMGLNIYPYDGAFVGEPSTNELVEDIDCYDWKGLYPSIIIAKNMSLETLVLQKDVEIYRRENRMHELHDIGNGVYFKKEPIGFLPKILNNLFELRYTIKREMKKYKDHSPEWEDLYQKQTGVKFTINAFYGIMKSICFQIAESTTFKGREMIKWTINEIESMGYKYLYTDTDSVYCHPQPGTVRTNIAQEITKRFHEKWGMLNCEIDYEGSFSKGIFFKKKRYALKDMEGNMKFRGIEVRRSDNSKIVKDLQKNILTMLLSSVNKKEIIAYIKTELRNFNNKKLSEIGIPHSLSFKETTRNNIYHIAAYWSNVNLKKEYKPGDKPLYVKAYNNVGGLCFDDDNDIEQITNVTKIDYDRHKRDTVIRKLENLFEDIGWDLTEIDEQTGLSKW